MDLELSRLVAWAFACSTGRVSHQPNRRGTGPIPALLSLSERVRRVGPGGRDAFFVANGGGHLKRLMVNPIEKEVSRARLSSGRHGSDLAARGRGLEPRRGAYRSRDDADRFRLGPTHSSSGCRKSGRRFG